MRIVVACVVATLLIAVLPTACGDGGVAPEDCTGTCIIIDNQSSLTISEVNLSACGDEWGENRLGSGEIAPGNQRAWSVTPGCWDIQAVALTNGNYCGNAEYGVDIVSGEQYVKTYDGCLP